MTSLVMNGLLDVRCHLIRPLIGASEISLSVAVCLLAIFFLQRLIQKRQTSFSSAMVGLCTTLFRVTVATYQNLC